MRHTLLKVLGVALWSLATAFFPVFIRLSELRSFSSRGHSLSRQWELTSLFDFLSNLKYVATAWDSSFVWLTTGGALINCLVWVLCTWMGYKALSYLLDAARRCVRRS